jgi:hydroxymethylbilane synthase
MEPLGIPYTPLFIKSHGDLDKKTSLRGLDKTDFFTREVDALVLSHQADFAIHSAKDLPENLPDGLHIKALTRGQDPADSLVIRDNASLDEIQWVATSSERREEAVKILLPNAKFVDIRGTIHERLEKLSQGEVDGVVIAEAALIRLGLNPRRFLLPGPTTPFQGQLAIVGRIESPLPFLEPLDCRPKETLYLGLRCPNVMWHHFPLIQIEPLPFEPVSGATHYIFTSRTAAKMYLPYLTQCPIYCTGKATAKELNGFDTRIASLEQAEGVVEMLKNEDLEGAHVVWPRAEGARDVIANHLKGRCRLTEIPLYRSVTTSLPPPDITPFSRLIFTSPSTVKAFQELFGTLSAGVEASGIGAVTNSFLSL